MLSSAGPAAVAPDTERPVQAVVLVGGEGTRLRPLTLETPKPMVPLMNMPFLERTLRRLKDAGIDDVILPAGYLPEAITSYFGDGSPLGLRIRYVIEEVPLGTAGALKNVEQYIDGPFFVLNGDVLTSLDLSAMLDYHRAKGGIATLHLIRVDDPSPFGVAVHDATGRIERFVEKPKREEAPSNEINAGTYILERAILDLIPAGRPVSIERETFPELIASGRPLYAYTTGDYWIDLGRPEAYLDAHRHIFDGSMPLGREPRGRRPRPRDDPGLSGPPAGLHRPRLPGRARRRRRPLHGPGRRLRDPGRRRRGRLAALGRRHRRSGRAAELDDRRQPRAHRRGRPHRLRYGDRTRRARSPPGRPSRRTLESPSIVPKQATALLRSRIVRVRNGRPIERVPKEAGPFGNPLRDRNCRRRLMSRRPPPRGPR